MARLSAIAAAAILHNAGIAPGSVSTDIALVETLNTVLRRLCIPLGKVEPDFPAIREALAALAAGLPPSVSQSEAA